jgi:hypothetical protein
MMRHISKFYLILAMALAITSLISLKPTSVKAEECTKQDFVSLFYDDYYPGTSWTRGGVQKTIKWTTSVSEIAGDTVSRAMTSNEMIWLREAIQSWDVATSSISFEESSDGSGELTIGWVPLQKLPPGTDAYWNAWWNNGGTRIRATIKFGDGESFLNDKNGFIHAARHEIGNVLGLGDIRPSDKFFSVMEDPWQPPYGNPLLDDFDYGLVRQLYGESTCPSTWKSEPSSPVTTPATTPGPSKKPAKMKITCVKGKVVKQISAVRPRCPAGYRKIK